MMMERKHRRLRPPTTAWSSKTAGPICRRQPMIEVVTEAKMPAPAGKIWRVLTDFDRYPEWHPWLRISGVAAPGASITCSLDTWGRGRALTIDAEITEFEEGAALSWVLGFRGVFIMEERFSIEQIATGAVLRHSVKCRGLTPLLLGWAMKQKLEHLLTGSNEALARQLSRQRLKSPTAATRSSGKKYRKARKGPRRSRP